MPKVSVVIPTYNRPALVCEAIESVLKQTYPDFEVIVVDDGSTDNTKEAIAALKDPRIRYIYQKNQGVSVAMNTGIIASGAECIAILDSDDVLFEEALEKGMSFMDTHPEVGFCYGQVSTMDGSGHSLRIKRFRGPKVTAVVDGKKELVELLSGESYIGHYIARRTCFEQIGMFKPDLRMSEDWDMWIRLAARYNVGHIAEPTVKARYHVQGLTAKSRVENVKNAHTLVLESVFQDAELGPVYGHLKNKAYFGMYCLLGRVAALTGHKELTLKHFVKAVIVYPGVIWDGKALSLIIGSSKVLLPQNLRRMIIEALIKVRLR